MGPWVSCQRLSSLTFSFSSRWWISSNHLHLLKSFNLMQPPDQSHSFPRPLTPGIIPHMAKCSASVPHACRKNSPQCPPPGEASGPCSRSISGIEVWARALQGGGGSGMHLKERGPWPQSLEGRESRRDRAEGMVWELGVKQQGWGLGSYHSGDQTHPLSLLLVIPQPTWSYGLSKGHFKTPRTQSDFKTPKPSPSCLWSHTWLNHVLTRALTPAPRLESQLPCGVTMTHPLIFLCMCLSRVPGI